MYYDSTELGAAMLELVRVRMKCRGPSAPPHHTQHLMIVGHKILIIRNFLDENWMLVRIVANFFFRQLLTTTKVALAKVGKSEVNRISIDLCACVDGIVKDDVH